jgi:hypothetical protein
MNVLKVFGRIAPPRHPRLASPLVSRNLATRGALVYLARITGGAKQ